MIEQPISIVNKLGLHARAAAKLVTLACSFQSSIELRSAQKSANGKSIMSVMMLAAGKGSQIQLRVEGDDEKQAFSALELLINCGFDEL